MGVGRRGHVSYKAEDTKTGKEVSITSAQSQTKPFKGISKRMVWEAYKKVKAKGGAGGVDGRSLEDFGADQRNNLYKLWNRMASGTYFPPAVKAVPIPKKDGGERILGIPTVGDRVSPDGGETVHRIEAAYIPSRLLWV